MKIVVDDKIPFIRDVFEPYAQVQYIEGTNISTSDIHDADALVIRTRTHCNQALLEGSNVRFIGTATIGYDHIDTRYCEARKIHWENAQGCNAASVQQYIGAALTYLQTKASFRFEDRSLGIIGYGNIGKQVEALALALGMKVMVYDPFDDSSDFTTGLNDLCAKSDIISFHVPHTVDGEYPTYHMFNQALCEKLKPGAMLMNTSRGGVVDEQVLLEGLQKGFVSYAVLDVFEQEPHFRKDLYNTKILRTPHIAGYALDGKRTGTEMIVRSLAHFFDLPLKSWSAIDDAQLDPILAEKSHDFETFVHQIFSSTYDIENDANILNKHSEDFEIYRGSYPKRWSYKSHQLIGYSNVPKAWKSSMEHLGFKWL